jgi:ligand-binding sensor domain-containing protein/signal transduction histidine kinase
MRKNFFLSCTLRNPIRELCFLVALMLCLSHHVNGQRPYVSFQHISNSDGLSQNHVQSIIQDKQGFMWFGTSEGMNRYDGYGFTIYNRIENDPASICHDNVSSILEGKNGEIWAGTGDGLSRYDRATNSFTSFVNNPFEKDGISPGRINSLVQDEAGNLWIGFSTGMLDFFDYSTKHFTHIQVSEDSMSIARNSNELLALRIDHNGNLWAGSQQGIAIVDRSRRVVTRYKHIANDPFSVSDNTISDIFRDKGDNIWVATKNGLNLFDFSKHTFYSYKNDPADQFSLGHNVIKSLSQDREGRLWIGTENGGLDIFDKEQNIFHHYRHSGSDKTSLSDNSVYSMARDKLGNMWVGTNSQGISFFNRFRKPFMVYQSSAVIPNSLSHNNVNAIAEQPGKGFWIATDGGGLNFFDHRKISFNAYRHTPGNSKGIQSDFLVDVLWDSIENCLWVATWGGGLSQLDPKTGVIRSYKYNENDPASIGSDFLWCLHLDKDYLYVGTIGAGLSIFNRAKKTFERYSTEDGLSEKNVVSIYRDDDGLLWMGSWGSGISTMDIKSREILPSPVDLKMKTILAISADTLGRIWFSGSPGMVCYDKKHWKSFGFTSEDGLPGSNVNGLLNDNKGNLWLSTNKGIVKFDLSQKRFETFTVDDGLPTNQFGPRLLLAKDGRMFFGSADGMVIFHPDSLKPNPIKPSVIITDLKIFNKSVAVGGDDPILTRHISETKELRLPYEYNFLTLNFVALNFTSSERNQYAYKLEHFDKDWVQIRNQRSATYTNLDPGSYTFHVKASNNDGLWNEEGARLIIHVMPPWWQTWWFRILFILMTIGMIVGVYRLRVRSIKNQNRRLNILVKERTNELHERNEEINKQNEILVEHEEELAVKNEELTQKGEEIASQRDQLTLQNNKLLERQEEIETQNEELRQSQEEISAQRDVVWLQNQKLEEARAVIEKQNQKIKLKNENLEDEIASRTKELLAYNQQLEQFAFISAHNLRAPVARILGLGKILELNPKDPTERKVVFEKMVVTARELDRVVRDLNTILEIKKNNSAVITEIPLNETLELVKLHIEKEIQETKSEIRADFSKVPVIATVKPYIESILLNLLSNAIKYRDPDRVPFINITTEPGEEYVCLTVTDNGLGIDTNLYKDKIFSLYQRFHSHVEGKGLGLYLVKTQIVALGGKIAIESEVGKGTSFKVYFKNP